MPSPTYQVLETYSKFLGSTVYNIPLYEENNFHPNLDNIPL